MRAGECAGCGKVIWKRIYHPQKKRDKNLWPRRDSFYPIFWTETGPAPGVGYCAPCCPEFGDDGPVLPQRRRLHDGTVVVEPVKFGPVIGIESAWERHRDDHYSERYGQLLAMWLHEELRIDPAQIMQEWETDRQPPRLEEKAAGVSERDDGRRDIQ